MNLYGLKISLLALIFFLFILFCDNNRMILQEKYLSYMGYLGRDCINIAIIKNEKNFESVNMQSYKNEIMNEFGFHEMEFSPEISESFITCMRNSNITRITKTKFGKEVVFECSSQNKIGIRTISYVKDINQDNCYNYLIIGKPDNRLKEELFKYIFVSTKETKNYKVCMYGHMVSKKNILYTLKKSILKCSFYLFV